MPKKSHSPDECCTSAQQATYEHCVHQPLFSAFPEVMNSKAAANALSIPERTLRELAREKSIKGFKVGTVWRFTRNSLIEFVEQLEAATLKG